MQPLAFALAGAAHRSEAAHALAGILIEGAGDRQLAGAATLLVPRHRGGRAPRLGPAAGTQRGRGFLFLLGRDGDFAGSRQRGDFCRCRLAGAFGDFAAGFFLAAARLFFLGSLARILFGALLGLFLFGAPANFLLGLALRVFDALLLLLAPAVFLQQGVAEAGFFIGLPRVLQRAHPRRVFFGGQGARRSTEPPRRLRRFRSRRGRDRLGPRDSRRGFGGARFRRAAGRDDPLFANLDRDLLRASMREALAHLAGLDRSAQAESAAGAQRQGPFLLLVRFSHALCFYHSVMPA